ncbi:MAG: isoprenoid biosynthesis glyoxalase ElbB [Moraxellaceae bacterium]|jgi:enhancing lycopene biosynthesis protein 2|nr:isoprenoid biosynthesis glyoxalase ElbB [Moraxellaceae bacterium]MBP8853000.1 isoprenoid biosynthesis glyoxalase ElbB [Moraxellaceae bacterium]MBP9045753.1 isoprenoid biosynthesis glyoxalase ElbB [Moraxellaceae bacterium]
MKKVAVILSGAGYLDGSEIHEATLTLLALDRHNAQVHCFAPDIAQEQVLNHATGEPSTETRSVLAESARIARGAIKPLSLAAVDDFDALIIPGGYGAARNLCNFASRGHEMTINPEVEIFARSLHREGKPVGLICIAPIMAPAIGGPGTRCTIGNDPATANAINAMGGVHVSCAVTDCVIDTDRKIVSTPAYMLADRITQAEAGINKLVDAVLAMA